MHQSSSDDPGPDRTSASRQGKDRARWLTDLAAAIDEAQRLAWRIGFVEGTNHEAMDLYARLELARIEVEALSRSPWALEGGAKELPSKWFELLPPGRGKPDPFSAA